MTGDEDLGAILFSLLKVIGDREAPILEAVGVSMWEYVILATLVRGDGMSQKDLAALSRRDPTRLIGNLDALESRGLIARQVDPADRRRRAVALTDRGRAAVEAARRQIGVMESELFPDLDDAALSALRRTLAAAVTRATAGHDGAASVASST